MTGWGDHQTPAGVGHGADSAAPAGQDALGAWRKALAAHNAALRRGARRPRGGQHRAGMIRRPPPEPDDAA